MKIEPVVKGLLTFIPGVRRVRLKKRNRRNEFSILLLRCLAETPDLVMGEWSY